MEVRSRMVVFLGGDASAGLRDVIPLDPVSQIILRHQIPPLQRRVGDRTQTARRPQPQFDRRIFKYDPGRLHPNRILHNVSVDGAEELSGDGCIYPTPPTTPPTTTSQAQALKVKLANIATGLWLYYEQYLPTVRSFQDTLRAPIQAKLQGEVKIGKWDRLNVYALVEFSDKIHRKLNKFLREYSGDVLDHPVSAILRHATLDDFISKSGELPTATSVPPVASICPCLG
eukprot:CAMPEP_0173366452 /NCGR_PEP_ID=MMETSP1144-20121109/24246_1 /TAXON_ID=483371 /ORGANISM="non described non described, Strain CCMP2298" /LENGTH=228 /DNA_ID=CAMNT_0014317109 /DNA_START=235 /DNA_END=918 /DNA_ORIENTATION=-